MSERQRRQAQQERDEVADEMVNSSAGKLVSLCYRYTVLISVLLIGLRTRTNGMFVQDGTV